VKGGNVGVQATGSGVCVGGVMHFAQLHRGQ
jgi:hypothetical protein